MGLAMAAKGAEAKGEVTKGHAAAQKQGAISKFFGFFPESYAELKKVHTPTRQETILMTLRVFGMIAVFSVFLGIVDFVVGWVMKNLLA